ncbi:MAG: hypothetical protein LBG20_03730, partial [Holosporaceae bacterium]|nr:hypothetical protein [Holosporaceae bacterium]
LTFDQAREIYHRDFWTKAKCESIDNENLSVKFFDLCVNMGINQATKLVQRALRSTSQTVIEDGIIGPTTLAAINKADPTDLLAALKSEAAGFYRLIAQANPSQQKAQRAPIAGETNIYFPQDGHQPTTPDAVAWSCANVPCVDPNTDQITNWYILYGSR